MLNRNDCLKTFRCMLLFTSLLFTALTLPAQKQNTLPDWAFGPFVRPQNVNPVLSPNPASRFIDPMSKKEVAWEANDVFNPAAAIKNNKIYVLYRAEDKSGIAIGTRTSRLGLAESVDGIAMKRRSTPVMFPGNDSQKEFEWPGGCEDPRVAMTADGRYVMCYTQWNKKVPRIGVATSRDLITWTKHGPAFRKAYNGRFFNMASKSASIITRLVNGKQVIAKINGKYWMYWGEHFVNTATSDDLVNWRPMLDEKGELKQCIATRKGFFDSDLTECGPPAIMTSKGILLIYNGKNKAGKDGDENYTTNTYAAGQVLFDLKDPTKPIARLDKPFFVPQEPFEKSGQYPAGTVFTEGLVFFKNKWFLYYGCADSRVAVAVFSTKKIDKRIVQTK
ncbi:MAG: glycosidase related protein [Segetibacter sp.]|nr:glycosidase related protein [Segetibacter sp.]MDB5250438.1 glycosidase related protein [Segetibacter sp.]